MITMPPNEPAADGNVLMCHLHAVLQSHHHHDHLSPLVRDHRLDCVFVALGYIAPNYSTKLMHLFICFMLFAVAAADNWAVIIAGSSTFQNYRHQADGELQNQSFSRL
jgi:hypothetical protein